VKERLLRYGRLVGYPAAYVAFLGAFAPITFPYDRLRDRMVYAFNADQRATGGQHELQVDHATGYWLSGMKLTGITLTTASSAPDKGPSKIAIDEATVQYSIFPALVGNSDLDFDVSAFGGDISGSFDVHGKDRSLDLTMEAVDLGSVTALTDLLGIPIEGKLEGSLHLKTPEGKTTKESGSMTFESKATAVGDGKAKIRGTLSLPRLDVGTVTVSAEAKDGVFKISRCIAGGKDLDFQCDGRITLRDNVMDALSDVQVRFRINDAYRGRSDVTKALFGNPGSIGSGLIELNDPRIKMSERPDGFFGWSVRGPLSRLDFLPAPR
jgi:type II secretion system protein N